MPSHVFRIISVALAVSAATVFLPACGGEPPPWAQNLRDKVEQAARKTKDGADRIGDGYERVRVWSNPNQDFPFDHVELEAMIFQSINQYRQDSGGSELKIDPRLANIARSHSLDMAANNFYSHTNLKGQGATARARAMGYHCDNPSSIGIAENIYLLYGHSHTLQQGRTTTYKWIPTDELVDMFLTGWTTSPLHDSIIMDPRHIGSGIGVAFGFNNDVYVTQTFC